MFSYCRSLIALMVFISGCANAECPCVCWQGSYISGQFDYLWRKEAAKFTNSNYFNTLGPQLLGSKFSFRSNNYIGGGAIGSNYQDECFVLGYEAGALFVNQKKSKPSPFFPTDSYSSTLEWMANAKVRAGLAYHRLFAYFLGGWAGGYVELKLNDRIGNVFAKTRRWANGWIIGAGTEFRVCDWLSLGVEYNYTQLLYRKQKLRCADCGNGIGFGSPRVRSRHQIQTVCLRLNFLLCCGYNYRYY